MNRITKPSHPKILERRTSTYFMALLPKSEKRKRAVYQKEHRKLKATRMVGLFLVPQNPEIQTKDRDKKTKIG